MGVEILKRYREFWGNKIDVEFVPFFLGGIMAGSGNKPPAFVPGSTFFIIMMLNDSEGEVYRF
jgi:hypothetical protein